ncbi:MAG: hypothetical protein K9J37_09255 [Saprospiraceae bacterium]|nr:hypothetical protein [Saprospiraceae bacterium]MCF8250090.1 hypothetical protein [Saprospiraceae bacterium]MCF8279552.1 hypothetical protein [Bacteroidales bacterium]MCF8311944.1 hypothetical protein [Saprospiraceae bacterium]MCF8440366.1 hypothetical protein [Saprospiraceae bacterium]
MPCSFCSSLLLLEPTLIAASNNATVQTFSFSGSLFAVSNKNTTAMSRTAFYCLCGEYA